MQFKTEPTATSVGWALRAVALMYLVIPLFALAAALDRPHVRSWPALYAAAAVGVLFTVSNASDLQRLRRARFTGFVPGRAFLQACAGTAVLSLAGVAFGLHRDTFLLLPLVPFLTLALVGDRTMMRWGWVVLVAAIGAESASQLPAFDALWATALFGGTAGLVAVMVDQVVRGAIHGMDRNRSLAELAAHASTMQDWPGGLTLIGDGLAAAMDVDVYAVLTKAGPHAPIERVFAWPESDWPTWERLDRLPEHSLGRAAPVDDGTLCATPAHVGSAAIVVVTPRTSLLGVAVDVTLTTTVAALLAAMYERARLISGLVDLALTDELTGLANRRRLFESLELEVSRARRSRRPLTVAMLDLDFFKRYNDTFGHTAGDELLRRFAFRTTRRLRAQDLVARYGGEEFCLVLPETDTDGALELVDGMRAAGVDDDPLGRRVSFSAGIATWDGAESAEDLVFRADASLYRAKAAGRDRVVAAPGERRMWPPSPAGGAG